MLLGEAFGALDNQTRALMQVMLLGISKREKKTVLFVTRDIEEAIFLLTPGGHLGAARTH
jgi:ABC-type nitrate/sulfonate/bicarbonate transport system ATPase subunit